MNGRLDSTESFEKRQERMKNRLKKLGTDNPIVKEAVKRNAPKHYSYEDFEVVHELVSAAYATYCEEGNLKQCLKDLSEAIAEASKKASSKTLAEEEDDY